MKSFQWQNFILDKHFVSVPQRLCSWTSSIFDIYINDLSGGTESFKVFADDTLFFFIVNNGKQSQSTIDKDLGSISKWAHQRKMLFNPNASKKAAEVIFHKNKDQY